MSNYAGNPAALVRKIRLYRNGDENFIGKDFVLNPRQVRTYDRFLQTVTTHVGFGEAVRSIRTPRHGTVVRSLDDLESNHDYVAVGYGRFKNISYVNIPDRYFQRLRECKRQREEAQNFIHQNRVSGRIRKVITDVVTINIYTNGDEMSPARKVILTFRMMQSWSTILAEINQHVNPQFTATRMLYTVDGALIRHKSEIQNGGYYVAVGSRAPFRPLEYGKYVKPAFTVSPRLNRRFMTSDAFVPGRHDGKTSNRLRVDGSSAESSTLPPLSTQSDPVTNRQRARHIRRVRDPKLVMYHDGQDVFHQKPIKLTRTRHGTVDYDKDEGGVFRAKTNRSETEDASEIKETKDTRVDLPLDFIRAEQVDEEDEDYNENNNDEAKRKSVKSRQVNNSQSRRSNKSNSTHHDEPHRSDNDSREAATTTPRTSSPHAGHSAAARPRSTERRESMEDAYAANPERATSESPTRRSAADNRHSLTRASGCEEPGPSRSPSPRSSRVKDGSEKLPTPRRSKAEEKRADEADRSSKNSTPRTYRADDLKEKLPTPRLNDKLGQDKPSLETSDTTGKIKESSKQPPSRSSTVVKVEDEKLPTPTSLEKEGQGPTSTSELPATEKLPSPRTSGSRNETSSPRQPSPRSETQRSSVEISRSRESLHEERKTSPMENTVNVANDENESAVKIQAAYRGHRSRKQLRATPD